MFEKMLTLKHECETYNEALGISEERSRELMLKIGNYTIKREGKFNVSEILDIIWNHKDFTFEEKVFLTFKAGNFSGDTATMIQLCEHITTTGEDSEF